MNKIPFDQLQDSMQYFLTFPNVEDEMEALVDDYKQFALLSRRAGAEQPHAEEVLADYLRSDAQAQKLQLIVAMSGGSTEKLKRIIAHLFDHNNLNRIKDDEAMLGTVVAFLSNPDSQPTIPKFIRRNFGLPANWSALLSDEAYMGAVARNALVSKYSVRIGFEFENSIRNIVEELGYTSQKGQVAIVDNKEVDIAIPNLESPQMLIMASYSLTTASSQTNKANEQARIYAMVQEYNRSRNRMGQQDCLFINAVDGGGWISRRNDLQQMWQNCDHCFTYNTLGNLRTLIQETMS